MPPRRRETDRLFGISMPPALQSALGALALSAFSTVIAIRIAVTKLETSNTEAQVRRELVLSAIEREQDIQNARIAALEAAVRRGNDQ